MSDKVIVDVDVFRPRVKVVSGGECECHLVIAVERGWVVDGAEQLADEPVQPNALLCGMRSCNIFGFSSGKGDKLLFARAPRDCTSIDEECVA